MPAARSPEREAQERRWRNVHLAGDRNPPITLSEPQRRFWQPDWMLPKPTRRGQSS
jgi:hypothetical protein